MPCVLKRCAPFALDAPEAQTMWESASAYSLNHVDGKIDRRTEVRLLWSDEGIYVRFDCVDERLAQALDEDFADLYMGDVIEIFLQPNRELPVYLEYELSPLNAELPLMVCNNGQNFYGWLPFHYEGARRAHHRTLIQDGEKQMNAACTGWQAECFIPFALLEGVFTHSPKSGDVWHGNLFRIDYGAQEPDRYALFPACKTDFHNIRLFEPMVLE